MFYYARTSNVDMAGLFWTAAGIYLYQRVLRKGLTPSRVSYLAFFAAAATASKDAFYSVFAVMALVVVTRHLRATGEEDRRSLWDRSRLIVVGAGVFAVTYSLISGLAFAPERFLTHVDFILHGTGDHPEGIVSTYYGRPLSIGGIFTVTLETASVLREALGLPFLLLSCAGIGHALLRDREKLLLLLPLLGIFFGVILPVRFIRLRFVVPLALGFAFFAARGAVVAAEVRAELERLEAGLHRLAERLDEGRGTAGRLLHDRALEVERRRLRARMDSVRRSLLAEPFRWLRFRLF